MGGIIAYLVIAAALFGGGAGVSWKITHDADQAHELRAVEAQEQRFAAAIDKANTAAANYEAQVDEARAHQVTVTKFVDRVVAANPSRYSSDCLDDAGVRAANAALGGATAPPSRLGEAVPGPDAARERHVGDGPAKAR